MTASLSTDALPPLTVEGRLLRLLRQLSTTDLQAFIVTDLVNVRWLTGFTGSAGFVVVTPNGSTLITDSRYDGQAQDELTAARSEVDVRISTKDQRGEAAERAGDAAIVGLEADHITWARQRLIKDAWFPEARIMATTGILKELRRAKTPAEVARIARAAAITDAALAAVQHRLALQPTESEFAFALEARMRDLGASGPAFDTIVASGPNGARPHHSPGDRTISAGDLVVVDCGALVDGYRSDMTRTFIVGDPSDTQQRMFDVVIEAQQRGFETAATGVPTADVDTACRTVIGDAGWADAFGHGTGHGVGLDIHELPMVNARDESVLAVSDVITVEPGVYLPDHGGVRIEDTVLIEASGPRRLTTSPKVLAVS